MRFFIFIHNCYILCSLFLGRVKLGVNGWYMLSGRISESVPVREDTELRNEPRSFGAQLAYHQTPPCNMYCVTNSYFTLIILKVH